MRFVITFLVLAISRMSAGNSPPIYELIAVGRGKNTIRLMTPKSTSEWRYYDVAIPCEDTVESVRLSAAGSKLFVRLRGSKATTTRIVDLTGRDPVWDQRPSHNMPGVLFLDSDGRYLRMYGDGADLAKPGILEFTQDITAFADDGKGTLIAATGSRIFASGPSSELHELKEQIPVVALTHTNSRGFRAITAEGQGFSVYGFRGDAGQMNVDMSSRRPINARDKVEAELSVLSEDGDVAQLASTLGRISDFTWSVQRLAPDPWLYAPVLQFSDEERIFPSDVNIWDAGRLPNLSHLSKGAQVEVLLRDWYSTLAAKPAVYFAVSSYPGTWLYEYWTYYALDRGGVDQHPHDTEHLFVEVDKLLGRVRNVMAAAHSGLTPNNIYSTISTRGEDPTLPLFAIVELGKHAMAPDINRDGVFSFGRDINTYSEHSQIWGIRDYIGLTDQHLLSYEASMTVPRQGRHRIAPEGFSSRFPAAPLVGSLTYTLLPLPTLPSAAECREPTKECALSLLTNHSDHKAPERILKPWVFPTTQVRVGVGEQFGTPVRDLSIGFVFQLREPLAYLNRTPIVGRILIPLPGRLVVEGRKQLGSGTRVPASANGGQVSTNVKETVSRNMGVGFRYERLMSNIFGFSGGVHWSRQTVTRGRFKIPEPFRTYFSVGPMFEVPLREATMTINAGPVWTDGPVENWAFELRISVSKFRWRPLRKFGIRKQSSLDGVVNCR